ncbi:MAG: DUF3667 domain-containing protein [Cyclobacteriaceae bacterium]
MEELGNTVPVAEGIVEAEGVTNKKPLSDVCLNCGAKLNGLFCSECGQKNIPKRQTLGELAENFLGSFFSYESKFLRSVKHLLVRPGFLAMEYNDGRRERYYHPARMYVFISFIFFFLFFSLPGSDDNSDGFEISGDDRREIRQGLNETGIPEGDSIELRHEDGRIESSAQGKGFSFSGPAYSSRAAYDSAQHALAPEARDGWLFRKLNEKTSSLNERYKGDSKEFGKDFEEAFMNNFSKVLFFLLPVFALVLKLLYLRRDFYYSEHLVFSIYYYNFFYLAAAIQLLFGLVSWLEWAATLIGLWILVYLLLAMKRMYNQSWKKTIVKFSLFCSVFMIFLGIGLTISALAVLLMI